MAIKKPAASSTPDTDDFFSGPVPQVPAPSSTTNIPKEKPRMAPAVAFLVTLLADSLTVTKAKSTKGLESKPEEGVFLITSMEDVGQIPNKDILRIFNTTRAKALPKFPSRQAALEKGYEAIQLIALGGKPVEPAAEAPAKEKAVKEPKAPKGPKLVAYEPKAKEEIKAARAGSKVALMLDLMKDGVEIMELERQLSATGKPVKIRSWLSYDLHNVHGYGVKSEMDGDNLIVRLKYPAGMRAPLAHKVPEPKAEKPAKAAPAAEAAPAKAASKKATKK